jgi:hypothetical protein
MGEIPEEDRIPYRHEYGNYTHRSADGRYRFEWTPFRPAIEAWENAERHLQKALQDMAEARKLPGFGLNGLGDEHQHMMGALKVLADHLQDSHGAVKRLVQAMEVANNDYAASNEASLELYKQVTGTVDLVREGQTYVRADTIAAEMAEDRRLDQEIFPFDGKKDG